MSVSNRGREMFTSNRPQSKEEERSGEFSSGLLQLLDCVKPAGAG